MTAPTSPSLYAKEYLGYPICDTSAITVAVLNRDQYYFGLFKEKIRTADEFAKLQKDYAIDTTQLAPRRIKSYVSIFTGLKGRKKVVIVDANNNHDFSDDTAFNFDTLTTERGFREDTLELAPLVKVQYERNTQQGVQTAYTFLRLLPYDLAYSYPGSMDMKRRLAVYTQPQVYQEGTFSAGGQEYKVSVSSGRHGYVDNYTKPSLKFQLTNLEYSANKEATISVGGTMMVNKYTFKLLACTRDGSELTVVAEPYNPAQVGGRVDNQVPVLLGFTADGNYLSVNKLLKQGNYVLLDFWGSWCGPCIASMPALKTLHDKVQASKIRFVGVDYEYNEAGQAAAQKLADKQQFSWPQVIEYSSKQTDESIPKGLDVTQYPTFLLLSPDGKILAREIGEDGLKKVEERLAQLKLLVQ